MQPTEEALINQTVINFIFEYGNDAFLLEYHLSEAHKKLRQQGRLFPGRLYLQYREGNQQKTELLGFIERGS